MDESAKYARQCEEILKGAPDEIMYALFQAMDCVLHNHNKMIQDKRARRASRDLQEEIADVLRSLGARVSPNCPPREVSGYLRNQAGSPSWVGIKAAVIISPHDYRSPSLRVSVCSQHNEVADLSFRLHIDDDGRYTLTDRLQCPPDVVTLREVIRSVVATAINEMGKRIQDLGVTLSDYEASLNDMESFMDSCGWGNK